MTISMEKIDELRKRTNCSYEEAKKLLEKYNGNVLEAIVDFEKNQHVATEKNEQHRGFWAKVKALFRKGFNTRFIVENNEETIVNLSVNFMILVGLFSFHILLIGVALALITGYKFRIKKVTGKDIDVDKIINNVTDTVKKSVNEMTEGDKNQKTQNESSDYNEVTVE